MIKTGSQVVELPTDSHVRIIAERDFSVFEVDGNGEMSSLLMVFDRDWENG